jgi:hypothetical protein
LRRGEGFAGRCQGMFDLRQARRSDIIRMLGDRSFRQILAIIRILVLDEGSAHHS